LRVLADDILYHRLPTRFTMEKQIGALEKIARQHPDNPVGQFCYWHFSRIARVLRTQNRSMRVTYWPINSGECRYFRR
ncbi:hypothetical protein Q604_UNBC08466G0002, partial [human gut metagenome]